MYFVSIKVLDFGEKSWKSPGISLKVLEKSWNKAGQSLGKTRKMSWKVLEFGLCFSVAFLWNLNSLAKENFERVQLIEAHNSIFNYDFISICETSLNDSVELPETLLDEYIFVPANNSANTRHGGVGLFYKTSLPVIVRNDLSFNESIVVESNFGKKNIFFTVLYRNPSSNHTSPEFQTFLANFENLYSNIKAEKPFATFFTGDFNAHSQLWWPGGDTTPEGSALEDLFTLLGLCQLISEPTNFEPHKNPSCIDLIITILSPPNNLWENKFSSSSTF